MSQNKAVLMPTEVSSRVGFFDRFGLENQESISKNSEGDRSRASVGS